MIMAYPLSIYLLSKYICQIVRYKRKSLCPPFLSHQQLQSPLPSLLPSTITNFPCKLPADLLADVLFQEYEAEEEEGSRSSKEDDPDGQCLGDTHGVDHPSSDFWVGWAETFGHGELVGVGVMDEVVQGDHEDNGDGHTKVTKSTTYLESEESKCMNKFMQW